MYTVALQISQANISCENSGSGQILGDNNTTSKCTTSEPFTAKTTACPVCASEEGQQSRTDSCTAIGGGLGTLAVVLALTLVGVVLGWVWYCHRNGWKFSFQER